jgi:hypothetical protein
MKYDKLLKLLKDEGFLFHIGNNANSETFVDKVSGIRIVLDHKADQVSDSSLAPIK